MSSSASKPRCLGVPSSTERPPSRTSSGPRIRKSTAGWSLRPVVPSERQHGAKAPGGRCRHREEETHARHPDPPTPVGRPGHRPDPPWRRPAAGHRRPPGPGAHRPPGRLQLTVMTMPKTSTANEHVLFSILHRAMVSDFAKLQTAVDDLTLADRVDRARAMDHWFRGFSKLLRHHHRIEHAVFWSALEEKLGPVPAVRQLLADHEAVDAALVAVQRGFWELRHNRDFVVPQAQLVALIGEARRAFGVYIDREEAEVVPLFQATFTGREFPEVDPRISKGLGLGGIAFAVPWGIGAMNDEERAA